MADKKVIDWIYKNAAKAEISFTQLEWPQMIGLDYYDYRAQAKFDGKIIQGRGISKNPTISLLKAFTELYEWSTCFDYGIKSTGVASHSSLGQAKINAHNEYLERLVYSNFVKGKSSKQAIEVPRKWKKTLGYFQRRRVKIDLYLLENIEKTFIVLADATVIGSGSKIIGLGANSILDDSIEKAFLECITNVMANLELGIEVPFVDTLKESHYFGIDYEELENKREVFKDVPLCVVRARRSIGQENLAI